MRVHEIPIYLNIICDRCPIDFTAENEDMMKRLESHKRVQK